MITDIELLENWPSRSDMDINDKKIWFARQVIRMAQEVRPLVFEPSIYNVLFCRTAFGLYEVHPENEGWLFYLDGYSDCGYLQTEAEAIAAAQADFNRRVLANLLHGGAE